MILTSVHVLDKGFVNVIQHMGDDRTVARAAWVSTDAGKGRSDADVARLIRYLARENHWTPFGHVMVTLHIRWPLFVARQAMRSNIGIVWNEESRRYVSSEPLFYRPATWRQKPPRSIKQGSGGPVPPATRKRAESIQRLVEARAVGAYRLMLAANVAPEMARMLLPVNMYTECWMTASVAALARFCRLRADGHAQWEIQEYARAIDTAVRPLYPVSWQALTAPAGNCS